MKNKLKISQHPLQQVVIDLIHKYGAMDVAKLSPLMAGGVFGGRRGASGNRAYEIVAKDVLDVMLELGILEVGEHGWLFLKDRDGQKCDLDRF